jgi:hypothetical protein
MHPIGDSIGEPALDFEAWRVLIQSFCGRYNPEGIEPSVFAGWVHLCVPKIRFGVDAASGRGKLAS